MHKGISAPNILRNFLYDILKIIQLLPALKTKHSSVLNINCMPCVKTLRTNCYFKKNHFIIVIIILLELLKDSGRCGRTKI